MLVTWPVWLVWILTTKRKSMKRVENFERYIIFSCHYLLILLINGFCFAVLTHYLDLIFTRFYSPDIYPFQFVLHWTLIVGSFVFEWHNLLGIWNDPQIYVFAECTFVSIQFLLLKVWSSRLTCIERWWWRSSVAAFVLQL